MAAIDSAYNYYLTTYAADQKVSRYDSHKRSDLRKVYNSIMKSNTDSPLYKITNLESAKCYAIDIKEKTKDIRNVVASLSDNYGEFSDSFRKKVAISSDEDAVSVDYVGDGNEKNYAGQFEIQIDRLATPQVNTGNYIKSNALSFVPGAYSIDLNVGTRAYELQFNVNEGENNGDVIRKLSRLVNSSNLGIEARVLENDDGETALSLASLETGLWENETSLFSVKPSGSSESIHAMDLLGIGKITEPAENSFFFLNGIPNSSHSNTFTINQSVELTLKNTTPENQPASIGFKTNTDAVADNIQRLCDSYNGILEVADHYTKTGFGHGSRLRSDMSSVSLKRSGSLEEIGLMVADSGTITIDRELLADAISPERTKDTFERLAEFRDAIGQKADNASVNPMKYVDKVIVEYKNPGHCFAAPYISSIYSGMLMDRCV